jgi:MoaA/NifB/PqqE/SkfB family radical SAM enzyme
MYWNVHVDGLEFTHDLIVEREGVFKECVAAIKMAKILGYQTPTNTTVYKETDVQENWRTCSSSSPRWTWTDTPFRPGYDYDAAKKDMVKRSGQAAEGFLPHPQDDAAEIQGIERGARMFTIFGTPVYQEFLAGKRELTCTAWAIPTYNVKGWKAPCYLMTDGHYAGYQRCSPR